MMIVTILSASVKCQWDLKTYQEALITTVTCICFISKIINSVTLSDCVLWNNAWCSQLGFDG